MAHPKRRSGRAVSSTGPSTSPVDAKQTAIAAPKKARLDAGRLNAEAEMVKEELYPFHEIVGTMMFVQGDSAEPLRSCREFMANLIHEQLSMLISKAQELAVVKGKTTIGYPELIFQFRKHPIIIRRVLDYLRVLELAPTLQTAETKSSNNDGESPSNEDSNEQLSTRGLKTSTASIFSAIKEFDVGDELSKLVDPLDDEIKDERREERLLRMSMRTKAMPLSTYTRFSEARTVSFCGGSKGKKSYQTVKSFVEWLGSPPLGDEEIAYVLNYCAAEIVAVTTGNALLCREQEPREWFTEDALQLRHYRRAVERSRGYAKRRDLLFGHY